MAIKDLPPPIKTPDSEKSNWSQLLDWLLLVWKFVRTPALVLSPSGDAPTTPTGTPGDTSTQIASDAFVAAADAVVVANLTTLINNDLLAASSLSAMYGMSGVEGILSTVPPPIISTAPPLGYFYGLSLSTAGSSTTLTIGIGQAADSTGVIFLSLLSSVGKTTASWAVGSGNGGIDTGSIANNTTYHWYIIKRPDTGVVDIVFSLSASSPTLPTNYTQFRYIAPMRTNSSGQWVSFTQDGDYFRLVTSVLDVNATPVVTTAVTYTLGSIPTGINVVAIMNLSSFDAAATQVTYMSDLAAADEAPSVTAAPLAQIVGVFQSNAAGNQALEIRTNTSAQIRGRVITAGASTLRIATLGWRYKMGSR